MHKALKIRKKDNLIKVLLILPQNKAKIDGVLKKLKVSFDVKLSIFPFSVLEDCESFAAD